MNITKCSVIFLYTEIKTLKLTNIQSLCSYDCVKIKKNVNLFSFKLLSHYFQLRRSLMNSVRNGMKVLVPVEPYLPYPMGYCINLG